MSVVPLAMFFLHDFTILAIDQNMPISLFSNTIWSISLSAKGSRVIEMTGQTMDELSFLVHFKSRLPTITDENLLTP